MKSDLQPTPKKRASLSDVIADLDFPSSGDRATVSQFADVLQAMALSAAIFVFAAINAIPAPPGTSLFLGIPLVIVCLQKMIGCQVWLPGFIMRASVTRERFATQKATLLRWMTKIEKWIHPRGFWQNGTYVSKTLDVFIFVLAICVLIPLPFTAIFPALCICAITLGRLEGDALWVGLGVLAGLASIFVVTFVIYGSGKLVMLIFA